MIERGLDDHTVMSISAHSSTRMLERHTPSTVERKRAVLETFDLSTKCPQKSDEDAVQRKEAADAASLLKNFGLPAEARNQQETAHLRAPRYDGEPSPDTRAKVGGRQEARTPDLRVANEPGKRPYLVARSRRRRSRPRE